MANSLDKRRVDAMLGQPRFNHRRRRNVKAGGMTVDELLADFPELTLEDVRACLAYAADQLPRPAA
jgi:uncharacterized protein (DUF433 family)